MIGIGVLEASRQLEHGSASSSTTLNAKRHSVTVRDTLNERRVFRMACLGLYPLLPLSSLFLSASAHDTGVARDIYSEYPLGYALNGMRCVMESLRSAVVFCTARAATGRVRLVTRSGRRF